MQFCNFDLIVQSDVLDGLVEVIFGFLDFEFVDVALLEFFVPKVDSATDGSVGFGALFL